jgi:DNA-binding YbaB/EbfC family protein
VSDATPPTDGPDAAAELPDATGGLSDLLGGGGFDMGALLEQAMEMQQQLLDAQSAAAETVVEGHAGGGAVRIRVTGSLQFESVTISPSAVDPDDVELLQDLVLAALRDAIDQIGELQNASMGGFDLGAMSGALGLGAGSVIDADEVDGEDEIDDDGEDPTR